jgi:hypothetical protein
MRQKTPSMLRAIVFAAAVLHLAACGTTRTSTSTPPGGTPVTASSNAASGPLLGAWWDASHIPACAPCTVLLERRIRVRPHSAMARIAAGQPACGRTSLCSPDLPDRYFPWLCRRASLRKFPAMAFRRHQSYSALRATSLIYVPGGSTALLVQGLLSTPTATR